MAKLVTMLTTMCGPKGNAFPGTVLDLSEADARRLLKPDPATQYKRKPNGSVELNSKGEPETEFLASHQPFAREYDPERDRTAKRGLETAKGD